MIACKTGIIALVADHSWRRGATLSLISCPAICRKQDPKRWIAYQKRKWKAKAAQRKKRRLDAAKARDGDQPPAQRPRALLDSCI